jgi:hypothetical protein
METDVSDKMQLRADHARAAQYLRELATMPVAEGHVAARVRVAGKAKMELSDTLRALRKVDPRAAEACVPSHMQAEEDYRTILDACAPPAIPSVAAPDALLAGVRGPA